MKNVFITGISGFVGSHLAVKLIEKGADVTGLQHDIKKKSYLDLLDIKGKVNIVNGDIKDLNLLQRILVDYKVDYVFHLAAVSIVSKAIQYPIHTYEANVFGTLALLEACRLAENKPKAIIVTSTDKVYGESIGAKEDNGPLNGQGIYESSKVNMDVISRSYYYMYSLPVVVTRACNIVGYDPLNSRIVPNSIKAMLNGKTPVIFEGEETYREYIHVSDVCDAYIQLAENIEKAKGKAVNVGTGDVISQEGLVLKIIEIGNEILGVGIKPRYVKRDVPLKEIKNQSLNSDKIRKIIGWKPKLSLEDGLRRTFREFMEKERWEK